MESRRPAETIFGYPFCRCHSLRPHALGRAVFCPSPLAKPQAFMRHIVRASLPLGAGTVLDPFMGGGSTIAAALAVGYDSMGVELDPEYFRMAEQSIPRLARLSGNGAFLGDDSRHRENPWNPKRASGPGQSNHITTIQVGTLCDDTSSPPLGR